MMIVATTLLYIQKKNKKKKYKKNRLRINGSRLFMAQVRMHVLTSFSSPRVPFFPFAAF